MLFRALRIVLAASFALFVWTIATPAWAAPAPYCDDRGASALAPPPLLDVPDVAIQRAGVETPCDGEERLIGASITRSHQGRTLNADAPDSWIPPVVVNVLPAGEAESEPPTQPQQSSTGSRTRVERPPRG